MHIINDLMLFDRIGIVITSSRQYAKGRKYTMEITLAEYMWTEYNSRVVQEPGQAEWYLVRAWETHPFASGDDYDTHHGYEIIGFNNEQHARDYALLSGIANHDELAYDKYLLVEPAGLTEMGIDIDTMHHYESKTFNTVNSWHRLGDDSVRLVADTEGTMQWISAWCEYHDKKIAELG